MADIKYDASTIEVLEGLEAIRKRPGMYIGNTDMMGLHHCVFEVVDNSVDEALQGHGNRIDVIIHANNTMTVRDYARGIPVDTHEKTGLPALEVIMTKLHAGGKFGGGGYKVSGGLHGIGVKAVNAVSEWMEVTVRKEGKVYRQRYQRGIPVTPVEVIGKTERSNTGTETSWKYDPVIFQAEGLDYSFKTLAHRFRDMCFLTPGLQITLVDEREPGLEATYYFQGGIAAFVQYLNRNRQRVHPVIYVNREVDDVLVEVAMQYTDGYQESIHTFANNINQPEGGTHLTGFRSALTRTINDYARRSNLLKEKELNFSGDDVREGLTAIVSVKVKDPQFEAQTKIKLNNPEVKGAVESTLNEALSTWLEENPRDGREIIGKVLTASRARAAMKKARDMVIRKSALESMTLPGKLADCSERDPAKTEMFIVEGDSAGGCFSGDTQVALADGRNLSFAELVAEQAQGKEHFCYTIRHDGTIGLERALHARVTKRNAEVMRVTLDNGETITCTPDHRFMLRDGSYKAASELTPDDSLMPLYRKLSDMSEPGITIKGYEMVWNPATENWHRPTLAALKSFESAPGMVDVQGFTAARVAARDKSVLRFDTFCDRYFDGDERRALDAVANYNHRIVSVERVDEQMDVYDIEVPHTHNFALASGVFVHNSAKGARDRRFQAILPLRGKIINVEKARINRILDNREVQALISALGCGIGDSFDLTNLRYSRIIIMSVDAQEMAFVKDPHGQIRSVRVGPFIDQLWAAGADPSTYEVLCFDPESGTTRFKTIKSVIRHDHTGPMYEIETLYGRSIRVTGEHSIFVSDEAGRPVLKRGDEIQVGDIVAAPAHLPLHAPTTERIDLLRSFLESDEERAELMVRGPGVEAWYKAKVRAEYAHNPQMVEERVTIPAPVGTRLRTQREQLGLSQQAICTALGIKQPVTYYDWEKGKNRPTLSHFVGYLDLLQLDKDELMAQVEVGESRLDHVWATQYNAAPKNRVRDYVPLSDLSVEDLDLLGDNVFLSPLHYAAQVLPRSIPVNDSLMMLLGFFVAEGSLSERNGVRFAIGKRNEGQVEAVRAAIREVFGLEATLYTSEARVSELRVLNRVVTSFFQLLFGAGPMSASRKHIPDLVFNVEPTLQLAFLRGYFMGDGTSGCQCRMVAARTHPSYRLPDVGQPAYVPACSAHGI